MSDNVTPITGSADTFDLGEFLSGANYPEETFKVIMDSAIGRDIHLADQAVRDAEIDRAAGLIDDEALRAVRNKKEALIEKAKSLLFTVTVRAVPRRLRQQNFDAAYVKYPRKRDMLGNEEPNEKRDDMFTDADWALHIIEMVSPDGRVLRDFNETKINYLRGNAPSYTLETIGEKIASLYADSKAGFESAAQETGFLSVPSHED